MTSPRTILLGSIVPIFLVLIFVFFSANSIAAETQKSNDTQAMLVLDASGSMWGQINGEAKISIAKSVISDIVTGWDKSIPLGLTVYGHRQKSACDDIELLQETSKINTPVLLEKVRKIRPKGKTPLSAAVIMAANSMQYKTKKSSVILISDGRETCGLDPCEVGKKLNHQGLDFSAHVISFDIADEDTAGLRCLAKETGGLFLQAKNADELKKAFETARSILEPQAEIITTGATIDAPAEVEAGSAFLVNWTGPKNKGDMISIKVPNSEIISNYEYIFFDERQSPTEISAPEDLGEYEVHYMLGDKRSLAKTTIKIVASSATISSAKEIVAGSTFSVEWSGPKNKYDIVAVFDTKQSKPLSYQYVFREKQTSPSQLTAPEKVGDYEVRYYTNGKKTLAKQAIQVVAAAATITAPPMVVAGSSFSVDWTGPKNKYDMVTVFDAKQNKPLSYQYVFREKQTSPSQLTAPEKVGDYEVRYYTNGKKTLAKQAIQVVAAAATITAPPTVVAGSAFSVDWTGPKNKYDMVAVFDTKQSKPLSYQYVFRKKQISPSQLTAPEKVGDSEGRYENRGKKTLAKQTIQVMAATATITAPPTVVAGSSFSVDWTGPKNKYDMVTVFDAKQNKPLSYQYVFREKQTSPSQLTAPEKVGDYEVRYYTNGKKTLVRQLISVVKADASVDAVTQVKAGEKIVVKWTGPKNKYDSLTIFDNKNKSYDSAYIFREKQTSPTTLTAPSTPGEYVIKYYTIGKNTLALHRFKVVAK